MSFTTRIGALSEAELEAVSAAACWYASYAARDLAAEAEDVSAYAVEARRSYFALVSGLRKLGIMTAIPDALHEHSRQAA